MKLPTQKEVIEFAQRQSSCKLSVRERMLISASYNWIVKQLNIPDKKKGIDLNEIGTDWNNGEFYKD
jgi:hypothetical protein